MRRSLLLATTGLAALTALGLLAAFVAVRPPAPVAVEGALPTAHRAIVHRFYDAVNAGIATGDAALLGAILASDYAESGAFGPEPTGREDLERYVLALHAAVPGARLVPETVVVEEDRVLALVRVEGADRADALGLTIEEPTIWPPVDAFRLAEGRIVERHGAGERRVLVEREAQVPLGLPGLARQVVTAVRIALPPATDRRGEAMAGPRVLYIERGVVGIEIAALAEAALLQATVEHGAGEVVVVPPGLAYALDNPGPEPAVLLEVSATAPGSSADSHPSGGVALDVEGPSAPVVASGRATLAPDAALDWTRSPGPVLLVVEAGALDLVTRNGSLPSPALVRRGDRGEAVAANLATLTAGDGVLIAAATAAEVRNAGDAPLVVRVVTVTPAAPGTVPGEEPVATRRVRGMELEPE